MNAETAETKEIKPKRINGLSFWVVVITALIGILISVNQLFQLRIAGFMPIESGYYYYILATFLSVSFLIFPARKKDATHLPWFDWIIFLICVGVNIYFAANSYNILTGGWEYSAPLLPTIMGFVLWGLALEGVRRTSGNMLFFICLIFSFYPVFGQYLSGMLWGTPLSLLETACYHSMGVESIIGIATRIVGNEIIGYIIFGAAIVSSGGGQFFMDLAMALMGKSRGGSAKVSVFSSAFMASLSGSVVSNIVTTGTLTIPAMVKTGYSPRYAASVEACASTGGTITPPIMGAAGFLVASFLNVPYSAVMGAVIFPAFLYFFMMFLQVDFHAAKMNIEGYKAEDLPRFTAVMKDGWFFMGSIILLTVLLIVYRITAIAPFYTILFLFGCAMIRKSTRLGKEKLLNFLYQSATVLGQLTAILAGIGLIIGAFSATGVANSFSRELLLLAGDNAFLLLFLGAATSFVLGIGMTVTACYVFLAVVLVPALVKIGFDPMAAHLFVMFCGNLSYITPPVALGAIAASTISNTNPMSTAVTSMKLGILLFILPFMFVLNPSLIFRGSGLAIAQSVTTSIIGSIIMAGALEGWIYRIGKLSQVFRVILFFSGLLIVYPEGYTDLLGLIIAGLALATAWFTRHRPSLPGAQGISVNS
ncbi:TRAP transporter fused permease subunit [Desulfosarcina sp. OttesenSCG-928-A07]|nr:TRAP transporter fused permease subunit [Desulfosarcina sp. OttesenSCG-928-G17]MDL2328962.1 TRAP transporter fused permease subunit [Desulfosarcina sp. OttesenSCG-928-A07]